MGLFDSLFGKKSASPAQNQPAQSLQAAKKVLIVEDDPALANALELTFQQAGYTVFKAENGKVGLDATIANKPDLILLDLQMPVMDGKEMLRNLRSIPEFKTLPVVVLTNAGDVDNIHETQMYYNVKEFLIKSNVNPSDILTKATQYLGTA